MLPSDFLELIGVDDPQIAADGRALVYVRMRLDLAENRNERSLWRFRDGTATQFTQGINDRSPRWSPDGRWIAFLRADDEKKTHVYFIAADGGEPRALAGPFARAGVPAWSGDSSRIAFAAAVAVEPADATLLLDEPSGARHVVALPFKSDTVGLFDGTRMQIHVATLGGAVRVVAKGRFDAGNPVWSPDGSRLVFVANPGVAEGSFGNDLFAVSADGGELRRLTAMNGIFGTPAFSWDGKELAVVGVDTDEISGRRNPQLWCVPSSGGQPRSLTPDRAWYLGDAVIGDLRVHENSPPFWTPDDREIVVQRSVDASCELVAFARDGSKLRTLVGGELEVYAFSGARDGTLAFASTDFADPGSIAILGRDGSCERLANENAEWLAAHPPTQPLRFRPRAADGTLLDAWVVAAPGNGKPPLVHAIHGGPHGAYGFAYFFEFQLLAQLGIAVVYGNPRGSQSYGEGYADAITGRWGELDATDLHAIREATNEHASFDERRIGVEGGSYGGLMTTWLLGHSKAYACGVSMRAVNDYVSFAGATDIPNFIERELGAAWDDAGRRLFELSPLRAAAAIDAPLLIMHSERDLRCPIDQGEQLFQRLRLLGKRCEYVRFTGDGHDLSRNGSPRNRLLRYRALAHWLCRYLDLERASDGAGWLFAPLEGEEQPA